MTETAPTPAQGEVQTVAGWTLTGLFSAFMLMDVGMKLAQLPIVEETGRQLQLPAGSGRPIGII